VIPISVVPSGLGERATHSFRWLKPPAMLLASLRDWGQVAPTVLLTGHSYGVEELLLMHQPHRIHFPNPVEILAYSVPLGRFAKNKKNSAECGVFRQDGKKSFMQSPS
jgi:hypothetical protein